MQRRYDPSIPVAVQFRVIGGVAPHPAMLAPKCGPLGISPQRIGPDILRATSGFSGQRIWLKMTVKNRVASFEAIPTCANLIIQALDEPKENRHVSVRKHTGNITMTDVIRIARRMRARSLAHELVGTVKEVLGTAVSIGCTVEGRSPKDITKMIEDGKMEIPIA